MSSTPVITRDENHVYRVDGRVFPSVTQIIKWGGLSSYEGLSEENMEFPMQRGTVVHKACEFVDAGDLDWDALDIRARGFVVAYKKFLLETGFKTRGVEVMFHSPFGFCGQRDRDGRLSDESLAILDLKTGTSVPKSTAVQLASYCYGTAMPFAYRRFAVRLGADGKYSMKEYPKSSLAQDWAAFMAALTVTNWKRNNGYTLK